MPHATNDSDRLRRRLDRAALAGCAARLLGWLGRVACVVAGAVVVAAACDLLLRPHGFPRGRFAVVAVVILAAIVIWRKWAGDWPTRLDAARAAEATRAELGERISRAVEFLESPPGGTAADAGVSLALRQLAVTQAAEAAATIGRLPVPGLVCHGPWIIGGAVAVAALVLSARVLPPSWGEAIGRQVALLPVGSWPGRGERMPESPAETENRVVDEGPLPSLPPAVADAAARIATASAIEARLATILAARFAHAPGRMTESLPADEQRDLDRLAAIQRQTAGDVRAARAVLESSVEALPAVGAALAELAALDAAALADSAEAVAANRLAIAATGATRAARTLAAASAHLGTSALDGDRVLAALAPAALAAHRRTAALLDEIGDQPRAAAAARETSITTRDDVPAGEPRPAAGAPLQGRPDGGAAGDGVATTEPRFGIDDAELLRPDTTAVRTPRERVWSLLPPRSQPFAERNAEATLPPEYKPAVDLYYALLLESLTAERQDGRAAFEGKRP